MKHSDLHIDSWKNLEVFKQQLDLNKKELFAYPGHWHQLISILDQIKCNALLDIGCGVGTISEVCLRELPHIKYTGIDYSEDAIAIAKREWPKHKWLVKEYKELTPEFVKDFDTLHAGAFLDVLPNGDEALGFLLSLQVPNIIIGRAKIIDKPSEYSTYQAYDKITTYAYKHNRQTLIGLAEKYEYRLYLSGPENQCNLIFQKIQ